MGRTKSGLEEGRGEIELWTFQSQFVISREGAARCGCFMRIPGGTLQHSVLLLVTLKAALLDDAEGIGEDGEGEEEEGSKGEGSGCGQLLVCLVYCRAEESLKEL